MQTLPLITSSIFIVTTICAVIIFWKATARSILFLWIAFAWLALQTVISITGFYKVADTNPPRFILLILPPLVCIIILFLTRKGRAFIDGLSIRWLTLLHVVRIPVEIVLLMLFIQKLVPGNMTFEGRNLDIVSGITAPIVYYVVFIRKKVSKRLLVAWNFICLGLLVNIVIIAVLSAPFSFQRFAFDQPNVGLFSFPFVWLPCCIVPLVLLSHLVSLRQLLVNTAKTPFIPSLA
jgi:hypothetical protein